MSTAVTWAPRRLSPAPPGSCREQVERRSAAPGRRRVQLAQHRHQPPLRPQVFDHARRRVCLTRRCGGGRTDHPEMRAPRTPGLRSMERRRRRWEAGCDGGRSRPGAVATAAATLALPVPPGGGGDHRLAHDRGGHCAERRVDVGFTGCLGSGCGRFTLDDDGGTDATLPDRITATGLAPGTYTVTQGPVGGLTLTGLRCVGGGTTDLAPDGRRSSSPTGPPSPARSSRGRRGSTWCTTPAPTTPG